MSEPDRLYIVDLSNMYHRAFHAVRPLTTSEGIPVNAVQGTANMLVSLVRDRRAARLAVALDSTTSWRKQKYPYYKANRGPMDDSLSLQVPYIHRLVHAMGIPMYHEEGYEADDVVASLVRATARKSVVVSGDKDFAQLVEPGVVLYDAMKRVEYDEAAVEERWGVRPDQMRDYLSLVGDSSDNVPGVSGVGPKTAARLLRRYGSIPGIMDNLGSLAPKVRGRLERGREALEQSRELVTMCDSLPLGGAAAPVLGPVDKRRLARLLDELEIVKLKRRLRLEEA